MGRPPFCIERGKIREKQCRGDLIYHKVFKDRLVKHPAQSAGAAVKSIIFNTKKYWLPSSQYEEAGPHAIVDQLPWRRLYDSLFSDGILISAIAAAAILWLWQNGFSPVHLRFAAALLLPMGYIYAISMAGNLGEWSEANRFKFFLEPLFYIFIVSQIWKILIKLQKSL